MILGGIGHFNPKIAFDFPPHLPFDFVAEGFVFGTWARRRKSAFMTTLGYYDILLRRR